MSAIHYPSHWTKSTLGQIVLDIEAGKSFRCIEKPPTDDWPGIVKVSAVSWGSFNEHESKTCPNEKLFDTRYQIRPGDLLMSRANTVELVGACVIVGSISKRLMLSDKILRIMLADDLKAWTLWYLRSKEGRAQIEARATGNQLSMRNIGQARILEIEIPLAPDRERLSIVEAIESYLTRLDDSMATLERVQRNLKRYRASVLKAAVEGRLVPTEAELARAEGREYEPASVLLERILAERRRRWEEAELAKMKAKGKAPKNDKWKAKYVEPAEPDTSELPELPEGWSWTRIDTAGRVQLGRQRSPAHHSGADMRPYLRVANVFEDRIDTNDVMTMNFTEKEFQLYHLKFGDILLNEGQSPHLVGRPAMYRDEVPGACFTNSLIRFQASSAVEPRFALLVFLAQLHLRRYMKIAQITTNIAHLGAGRFAEIEFPLPPLPEQLRISEEVDRLLTTNRAVARAVTADISRLSRLRQSILKWAFEGRLVDQDPNDEPAELLLERIHAERAAPKGRKQPRTRRVNTRTASA